MSRLNSFLSPTPAESMPTWTRQLARLLGGMVVVNCILLTPYEVAFDQGAENISKPAEVKLRPSIKS